MFSKKENKFSLPPPPTEAEILADLASAPLDDVVFMTKIPSKIPSNELHLKIQLEQRIPSFKEENGEEEGSDASSEDAIIDKIIAIRLQKERIKTLQQELKLGTHELKDAKTFLKEEEPKFSNLIQTTKQKQNEVKQAKEITSRRSKIS